MRDVKPPLKVYVETYEFPLYFVLPDDEALLGNEGITGLLEEERGIWISEALEDSKLLEIVRHEVNHAINWVYGVDDFLANKKLSMAKKEEAVAAIHGRAWSRFYLDNPKFVQWHMHVLKRIWKDRNAA